MCPAFNDRFDRAYERSLERIVREVSPPEQKGKASHDERPSKKN